MRKIKAVVAALIFATSLGALAYSIWVDPKRAELCEQPPAKG